MYSLPHSVIKVCILLMLCVFSSSHAQSVTSKNFIVIHGNDTLYGRIKAQNTFVDEVFFKEDSDLEFKRYTAGTIEVFRHDNIYYYAHAVPGKKERIFMRLLVGGPVQLYKVKEVYYLEKDGSLFKLQKRDTIINNRLKEDKAYTGLLRAVLTGCEKLIEKFPEVRFSDRALASIIIEYNRCVDPESNPVHQGVLKLKSRIGFKAGPTLTQVLSQDIYYSRKTYEFKQGFTAGIFINLFLSEQFSLRPELLVTQKRSVYDAESSTLYGENYNLTLIQLPISVQYIFLGNSTVKPYICVGGLFGKVVSQDAKRFGFGRPDRKISVLPNEFGYRAGLGASIPFKSLLISFEYLYEKGLMNQGNPGQFRTTTHEIAALIGF